MKTELKKIQQLTCLILMLTSVFVAVSFLPRASAVMMVFKVDPASGKVGTKVEITANITTLGGAYEIRFDDRLVVNKTAETNLVVTTFTVPDATEGTHTVNITDKATGDNATNTFTVEPDYSVSMSEARTVQEGDSVPILVNMTGGESGTHLANVTVLAPTSSLYVSELNVSLSSFGNGTATVNFPADFSSGANTRFVGAYGISLNTTLANSTFSVGLTNATEYHRNQVVNVKAVYEPNENVTLSIAGEDVDFKVNLTDSSGLISYDWSVPATAAIGSYNVRVVPLNQSRIKSPRDNQNFTVPGFVVNFTAKNLAGESVPSVTIRADEGGTTVDESTSASTGLAVLNLEVGNFSCGAYFKGEAVGNQTIAVNEAMSLDFVCNLTNLRIRVVSVVNGAEMSIPEAGVFLTPDNTTFSTDINGTVVLHSLLPNASYGLNLTRFGASFNVTAIPNLLVNNVAVAWFDVKARCPTLSLRVAVTKADGQAFSNAVVKAQELLGAPRYEGNTDAEGVVVFNSLFGRYQVGVSDSNGVLLNETVVDLFGDKNVTVPCDLYGLTVSVKVVDYFGQGIANVNVKLQGKGQAARSGSTQGDGTATFNDVIGGVLQVVLYMGDSLQPVAARGFAVENSTTLRLDMDNYVVFAGMLVEASVLTTIIIVVLAVVLVLVVEVYRRTRFKAQKSETDSSNKES